MDPIPSLDVDEEVRLAVVLYGGSSLCIYMNGVTQELLHLVRATAGQSFNQDVPVLIPTAELGGSERAYRRLAQLDLEHPAIETWKADDSLRRRFVIDILTGSSAGGINGIFLAKALANNQSLDELKRLWIEKGDIGQLYNEAKTAKSVRLAPERPPRSLLDGRWMYRNILDAMDQMGPDLTTPSPLVQEIDLYVTATDLYGLPVSIRLANGVAVERRHRSTFHFRYSPPGSGEECRDFDATNNPFLAFAARCTSSLPFVFQPMTLASIDEVLAVTPGYQDAQAIQSRRMDWSRFYRDYWAEGAAPGVSEPRSLGIERFVERPFGDGGSLDNSPFTWATERLAKRHADLPVSRKLLYLEPDPVTSEGEGMAPEPPNALQNLLMQGMTLPRYQTISEDLAALKERNRMIRRVDAVLHELDPRLGRTPAGPPSDTVATSRTQAAAASRARWLDLDERHLRDATDQTYVSYHRLKIGSVIDDLATIVTMAAGLEENSDEWSAIRAIVDAWCFLTHVSNGDAVGRPTLNQFLLDYDLGFRMRRVSFVLRRASELDRAAVRLRSRAAKRSLPDAEDPERMIAALLAQALVEHPPPEGAAEIDAFLMEIRALRRVAGGIGRGLWRVRSELSGAASPILPALRDSGITRGLLKGLLQKAATHEALKRHTRAWVQENLEHVQAIADSIKEVLHPALTAGESSSDAWRAALDERACPEGSRLRNPTRQDAARDAAQRSLDFFFENYEIYDVFAFPMLYGTGAGETSEVEVFRISPVDAPTLDGSIDPNPKKRVSGTAYGHFGAFLERVWRENDVMWGRMDAAGCIIEALVPDDYEENDRAVVRAALLREAHRAIVSEELGATGRQVITTMLLDELARQRTVWPPAGAAGNGTGAADAEAERLAAIKGAAASVAASLAKPDANSKLETMLMACLEDDPLLDYVNRNRQTEWRLPAQDETAIVSRGTHVLGEVFKGMAGGKGHLSRPAAWMSMAGKLGASAAEVAVPSSFPHLLWRHWVSLLLTFEALMLVLGWIFHVRSAVGVGLTALWLTMGANLLVWIVAGIAAGKSHLKVAVTGLVSAILLILIVSLFFESRHMRDDFHRIPLVGRMVHTR